jgi:hypothetical protein
MTAAMLVLEPIFEADLPSELYAYPLSHLYGHFGLLRLSRLGHDVPSTKA